MAILMSWELKKKDKYILVHFKLLAKFDNLNFDLGNWESLLRTLLKLDRLKGIIYEKYI